MPRIRLDPAIPSSLSWQHRVKISKGMKQRWKTSRRIWKNNFGKSPRLISGNGYVRVLKPNHPRAQFDGYVLEHLLVIEQKLGRSLTKHEVCHHIDGNRSNNSPENLIALTKHEHSSHHIRAYRLGEKYGPLNKGEHNGLAKLSEKKVYKIRSLHKSGKFSYEKLANKFKVSYPTIQQIVTRVRWKHLMEQTP